MYITGPAKNLHIGVVNVVLYIVNMFIETVFSLALGMVLDRRLNLLMGNSCLMVLKIDKTWISWSAEFHDMPDFSHLDPFRFAFPLLLTHCPFRLFFPSSLNHLDPEPKKRKKRHPCLFTSQFVPLFLRAFWLFQKILMIVLAGKFFC